MVMGVSLGLRLQFWRGVGQVVQATEKDEILLVVFFIMKEQFQLKFCQMF